jgi:hypothetical protein
MRCESVLKLVSPFLDEVLGEERARCVSGHLEECSECRREYLRLKNLRHLLGSLGKISAPDYLRHLVELRIASADERGWKISLQGELEYRWSRIRTTGSLWYLTRLLGTVATCVLFVAITAAIRPIYFDLSGPLPDRAWLSPSLAQQLKLGVLGRLGMTPLEAQKRPISPSEPQINDLYLLNFAQSASLSGRDDTLSVVASVDRKGSARIQGVIEHPADSALLSDLNSMIQSTRCRPASQNGKAVDSHLVLSFTKVTVYD